MYAHTTLQSTLYTTNNKANKKQAKLRTDAGDQNVTN